MIGAMQHIHFFKHFFYPPVTFCRLYIKIHQWELNILIYSQFINQIKALEDETDISFSESGQLVFIHFIHSLSFKEIGARSRGI